jgi:hypothetical protein
MFKEIFQTGEQKGKPKTSTGNARAEMKEHDTNQKLVSLFESGEMNALLKLVEEIRRALSNRKASLDEKKFDLRWKARAGLQKAPLSRLLNLSITEHLALLNYNGYIDRIYDPAMKKIKPAQESIKLLQNTVEEAAAANANAIRLEKLRAKAERGVKTNQPDAASRLAEIEREISKNKERKANAKTAFYSALPSIDLSIFSREEIAKITAKADNKKT